MQRPRGAVSSWYPLSSLIWRGRDRPLTTRGGTCSWPRTAARSATGNASSTPVAPSSYSAPRRPAARSPAPG